ncbi:hypothetical protein Skr01_22120 [Sphaerisporangium krabiense]|uniref:Uncharacterized protein n=1 Tax=Sphaerisporangium krabiense TaxID=763782 RepID=A0A7W8Z5Y7_9ACTN|nr:hypothetical protein [Sphaerisporangium krabiense]MBB5627965.1 hypothetical protein [Sphaerisporangium krabiense]GII62127.1 hypothetical protein Skr01_22120 [Sphaerisporangium krabiense]
MREGARVDVDGRWAVLIEEQGGSGEGRDWRLTEVRDVGHDRDGAVRLAETLAREYAPKHPWAPRGRAVYRAGEGVWLVVVAGATRSFHFRVTVAEHVATLD